jgi:hypothetical protein
MMKWASRVALAIVALLVAGPIGFPATHHRLVTEEGIAEGNVLLVGKVLLVPPVKVKHPDKQVYYIILTDDMSRQVNLEANFSYIKHKEYMEAGYERLSLVSITPGARFIRMSQSILSVTSANFSMTGAMRSPGSVDRLNLTGDLKIVVPAGVKAVYIGTIVYSQDGNKATGVQVRDEYAQAMAEMARQGVPGVRPQDVVMRLVQVVKQP